MKYDYKSIYEKNSLFLERRPLLKKAILLLNDVLPLCFFIAYGFLWAYGAILSPLSAKALAKIFFVPVLALFSVTLLRLGFHRPRPYSEEGAGITPLREKRSKDNSFPSRHLTCAAVLAITCMSHLFALGILLFLFTLLLAYCRFSLGWHYPSDLLAGILLGSGIGCLLFV